VFCNVNNMARFGSPLSSVKATEDSDIMGVIGALELICELESRLRHAIQQTHPLTTSLEWDFQAADRERAGLLAIRYVVPISRITCIVSTKSASVLRCQPGEEPLNLTVTFTTLSLCGAVSSWSI